MDIIWLRDESLEDSANLPPPGVIAAAPAQAYGTDHVYQLTFSLNCNDRTSPLCAPDMFTLGGVWGWIEPDSDGTADATVTFCGHGQGFNGAFHENLDGVFARLEKLHVTEPAPSPAGPHQGE